MAEQGARRQGRAGWYALLLVQYVVSLCVPFYNTAEPYLGGIPFFYWYQLAMVLVCAALTGIVYFATERGS